MDPPQAYSRCSGTTEPEPRAEPTATTPVLIGIDASNIREGGGPRHLREFLTHADLPSAGIDAAVVWSSEALALQLPNRPWLRSISVAALGGGLVSRTLWQQRSLRSAAISEGCDVVLCPGGTSPMNLAIPVVTMFRNALLFEHHERRRYGLATPQRWRLELLRRIQASSMRRADGVILLSEYGRELAEHNATIRRSEVIPHGITEAFFCEPRQPRDISECTASDPFRILYVSEVRAYKHHPEVIRAVHAIRRRGLPVSLTLAGGFAERRAALKAKGTAQSVDPDHRWIRFEGHVPPDALPRLYRASDLFAFASTCENLPNTLLEAMASGLPIAASRTRPMPDVAGRGAAYFDASDVASIEDVLATLIDDTDLRLELAMRAHRRAQEYSWRTATERTLKFVAATAQAGRR